MVERRREVGAPVALTEYNGADIVALFRAEDGEVFAESWDMTSPRWPTKSSKRSGVSTS
jgi:hypothetical protein